MDFKAKHVTRNYRQIINAAPEIIFPLLCPVREKEWLDGWDCRMIYSESGLAEQGAVFSTSSDGELDTTWIITNHDPINKVVQFARFTHQSRTSLIYIYVLRGNKDTSFVDITYSYTAITDHGNKFIDGYTEDKFLAMIKFWEKSMNHYLETGNKLIMNH